MTGQPNFPIPYFHDNDPFVVAWLRELYPDAAIQEGDIGELEGEAIDCFRRVHLFAGIGGWEYALHLARWPADIPVWTGSCPCQPFSTAGKRGGQEDARHLWPQMLRLIDQCRPTVIFGEQVSSRLGRDWLAGVRADMEALGYAVGAADLCAAGSGAPHIRQRLYWVAYDNTAGPQGWGSGRNGADESSSREGSLDGGLAHSSDLRRNGGRAAEAAAVQGDGPQRGGEHKATGYQRELSVGLEGLRSNGRGGGVGWLADAQRTAREPWWIADRPSESAGAEAAGAPVEPRRRGDLGNPWTDSSPFLCLDGHTRRVPVEPALFPMAPRVSNRVGMLRGAGNSIVPQTAAAFIRAFMEVVGIEA